MSTILSFACAKERKYSIKQVAENLGIHISTVTRLMDAKKLGYYQIGARRVVGEGHLQRFLELAEREAKAKTVA